jgi:hypothetical protein
MKVSVRIALNDVEIDAFNVADNALQSFQLG